jgi:hypothetical protein
LQEGKSKTGDDDDLDDDLDDEDDGAPSGPLKTTFELNDTLYAEAELEDTDEVSLWLGVSACSLVMHVLPLFRDDG